MSIQLARNKQGLSAASPRVCFLAAGRRSQLSVGLQATRSLQVRMDAGAGTTALTATVRLNVHVHFFLLYHISAFTATGMNITVVSDVTPCTLA